ncbi:asparagine synthase-related protein [Paenibacillus hexagrammi]|uniref:asparagine synthase (glutamine-hydrolyzing) n=1 Tax=Paenibacillus hexagrammi TaxID=2908839 RepID=A0ABY3SMW3_9BACL|nr:asparagine synthase-related protein [Paenibacillus sp. YPD9-1]UJF34302.1 asparagine synthase-related protein [Paenibacillus sp. YPD9-1]
MSAIVGIYCHEGEPVIWEDGAKLMQALQRYHADYTHTWRDGSVFLGCHAQWIAPESIVETLPMHKTEYGLAITADAIIDNRDELFQQLQIDYKVRNHISDGELILLTYLKWGEMAPEHIIGDFTFVIWDEKKQQLFGARDLSGNRTLYYCNDSRRFVFSTAIFPLFTLPGIKKVLNQQWLAEFLTIPDMYESENLYATPYAHIRQLPPAHSFTVKNGKISTTRYAVLSEVSPLYLKTNEEYVEAFREVFQEAVDSRLRTHKEIGAALSGGLDSGAVVSYAAATLRKEGKPIHAYSYVPVSDFVDWTSKRLIANERPFIQSTAQFVGNIKENYLDFSGRSPYSEIDELLTLLEVPYKYFENSFWIKGLYEKARDENVGVLLTGARGNFTISWGPTLEYYTMLMKRMKWIHLSREIHQYSKLTGGKRSRLLKYVGKSAFPFLSKKKTSADSTGVSDLINPNFAQRANVYDQLAEKVLNIRNVNADAIEVRKEKFTNLSIANKNGALASKLSLDYGLLERDPTNDPRVVRFCLSVPIEQYIQNGQDRSLIRRATHQYLPDKVRLNQKVRGVQPADWVHRMTPAWDSFIDEIQQLCKDEVAAEYLNMDTIRTALSELKNPMPEHATDPKARLLMHSLIVYRFLKKFDEYK